LKHIREDLVHGHKGKFLRQTSIIILGNGPIAANLRMLFIKAGYSNLTWVMNEQNVTKELIGVDPLLKLDDLHTLYVKSILTRARYMSTATDRISINVFSLETLSIAQIINADFVLMADEHIPWVENACRKNTHLIYGVTVPDGFQVDLMVQRSVDRKTPHPHPHSCFNLATTSILAASQMLSLSQYLSLGKLNKCDMTSHFRFPGVYLSTPLREHIGGNSKFSGIKINKRIIQNKKIALVGCGAIGSHVATLLAEIGFEKVSLIDFDDVREHNLSRLAMAEISDVGKNKANLLMEKIRDRFGFSYTKLEHEVEYIAEGILIDHDMILCCSDRNTARRYLAGIARIKNIPLIQGGFGSDIFQISTGTEIDSLFIQIDAPQNSCTGLTLSKKISKPIGSTQGNVAMTAASMVEASLRMLTGDLTIVDKYITWRFPERVSKLKLKPMSISVPQIIVEMHVPDGDVTIRDFLLDIDKKIPGGQLGFDQPFLIQWDCLVCKKNIQVKKFKHHLSDIDRFHAECIAGKENMIHMNYPQRQLLVEDRLHLRSNNEILSLSISDIGILNASVKSIYKRQELAGYVRVRFDEPRTIKEYRLVLDESVLKAIHDHATNIMICTGHEAAGILFGEVIADSIFINDSVAADVSKSSRCYVEVSSQWLAKLLYETQGKKILCGWWHSHPGLGILPSQRDIKTFRQFSSEKLFSMIYDPTAAVDKLAVYQCKDRSISSKAYYVKEKNGIETAFKKTSYDM
jgi:molybdopterin/thiamine biosynthesis adenylyltransferase/proteasome lid subunit RPN8/RPN11